MIAMAEGLWQIEMLGGFQVRRADRGVIRFETQKTRVLLAYLAYFSGRAHPRTELIEMLWPECDREAGQHRPRQALYALRSQLDPPGVAPGSLPAPGCRGLYPICRGQVRPRPVEAPARGGGSTRGRAIPARRTATAVG